MAHHHCSQETQLTWIQETNRKKRLAYFENSSYKNLGKKLSTLYLPVVTRLCKNFCSSLSCALLMWMMRAPFSPGMPDTVCVRPVRPANASFITWRMGRRAVFFLGNCMLARAYGDVDSPGPSEASIIVRSLDDDDVAAKVVGGGGGGWLYMSSSSILGSSKMSVRGVKNESRECCVDASLMLTSLLSSSLMCKMRHADLRRICQWSELGKGWLWMGRRRHWTRGAAGMVCLLQVD